MAHKKSEGSKGSEAEEAHKYRLAQAKTLIDSLVVDHPKHGRVPLYTRAPDGSYSENPLVRGWKGKLTSEADFNEAGKVKPSASALRRVSARPPTEHHFIARLTSMSLVEGASRRP